MVFRRIKYLRESWRNQRSENLEDLQLKKLKYITNYAYKNTRFYRHLWRDHNVHPSDIHSLEDFEKFPVINRETVIENYQDIISQDFENHFFENKIAGSGITASSSGEHSFRIFYNQSANEFYEINWYRSFMSLGYSPTDALAYFWYKPFNKGLIDLLGLRRRHFVSHKSSLKHQIEKIEEINPEVIYYLTSVLYLLAEKKGFTEVNPNFIVTHGGILSDSMRNTIERSFNAPVYDIYGSTEFKTMAWECKKREGYHINSDSVIMEFLDGSNRKVSGGERGRVVVTGLRNTTFPLIRYDLGDIAVPLGEKCSCGRELPMVKSFEGRRDNFICEEDGELISPKRIINSIDESSILKFRVKQTKINSFKVLVELKGDCSKQKVFSRITENLKEILNDSIKVDIEERNLEISERGKFQMVDSLVECDDL